MQISIDSSRCMGHGRCYAAATRLLTDDEEGFVAQRGQTWKVPGELRAEAYEAADACPESAITILENAPVDV